MSSARSPAGRPRHRSRASTRLRPVSVRGGALAPVCQALSVATLLASGPYPSSSSRSSARKDKPRSSIAVRTAAAKVSTWSRRSAGSRVARFRRSPSRQRSEQNTRGRPRRRRPSGARRSGTSRPHIGQRRHPPPASTGKGRSGDRRDQAGSRPLRRGVRSVPPRRAGQPERPSGQHVREVRHRAGEQRPGWPPRPRSPGAARPRPAGRRQERVRVRREPRGWRVRRRAGPRARRRLRRRRARFWRGGDRRGRAAGSRARRAPAGGRQCADHGSGRHLVPPGAGTARSCAVVGRRRPARGGPARSGTDPWTVMQCGVTLSR